MSSPRRVVITGLGVLTPIGVGVDKYWESLRAGRTGIRRISAFDASTLPSPLAGEIPDFDAKQYIDKKERKNLRVMARAIQMAVAAAQLAIDDGRVDKSKLDPTRFGVEFGSGLLPSEPEELGVAAQVSSNCQGVDMNRWGEQGLPVIPPLWMLKYLPNMLACHVSILHDAQGPSNSITESDVAGLLALGEAYRIIGRDQADFFLVGGSDSKVNPLSLVRQCLFQQLSLRSEAPEQACRPFDRRRDGMVIGEGAGVLVLEELEHARRRSARIYGEVVGFGASFDRARDGAGLARAVGSAMAEAGIGPEEVDHVNANGFSTLDADVWEAHGLQEVFGNCRPAVLAAKSYFGSLGAASGTTELAASILGLKNGQVPATLNYQEPDPACPVTVTAAPQPVKRPYVVKVSFTDMGQCAAVVCKKWD